MGRREEGEGKEKGERSAPSFVIVNKVKRHRSQVWCTDEVDGAECLGIVCCSHDGCALHVSLELPKPRKGDVGNVHNCWVNLR